MTPILETRRLKLREFSQGDLDDLAAMVADEEQMRFYPRPKTRDEASAWRRFALLRLVAIIRPDHIASRCVAENIGMHDEKTTVLDDYPAVIYTTEWRSSMLP